MNRQTASNKKEARNDASLDCSPRVSSAAYRVVPGYSRQNKSVEILLCHRRFELAQGLTNLPLLVALGLEIVGKAQLVSMILVAWQKVAAKTGAEKRQK